MKEGIRKGKRWLVWYPKSSTSRWKHWSSCWDLGVHLSFVLSFYFSALFPSLSLFTLGFSEFLFFSETASIVVHKLNPKVNLLFFSETSSIVEHELKPKVNQSSLYVGSSFLCVYENRLSECLTINSVIIVHIFSVYCIYAFNLMSLFSPQIKH